MTPAEEKCLIEQRDKLEERFKLKYPAPFTLHRGKPCFQARNGHYFFLTALFPQDEGADGFIVIEHADSLEEVELNRFEDGDCFYMDELTEDEMFEAMIKEIEVS